MGENLVQLCAAPFGEHPRSSLRFSALRAILVSRPKSAIYFHRYRESMEILIWMESGGQTPGKINWTPSQSIINQQVAGLLPRPSPPAGILRFTTSQSG
jgi:hypothetical protein